MKTSFIPPFLLVLVGVLFAFSLHAQEITSNAAYKARIDSLSGAYSALVKEWNASIPPHNRTAIQLERKAEANPAIRDSLLSIAKKERQTAKDIGAGLQAKMDNNLQERQALQERYSLVFEDAFPYFALRKKISKDSLAVLLNKASDEIRDSETGKALRYYIENSQFAAGT